MKWSTAPVIRSSIAVVVVTASSDLNVPISSGLRLVKVLANHMTPVIRSSIAVALSDLRVPQFWFKTSAAHLTSITDATTVVQTVPRCWCRHGILMVPDTLLLLLVTNFVKRIACRSSCILRSFLYSY